MYKLAVDIGGTKTIVGVIDEKMEIIDFQTFETIATSPQQQFDKIVSLAKDYKNKYKQLAPQTLNIAMPGPCEYKEGIFLNPPNLQQYNGFNAGDYIRKQSDFDPAFVNDTDAAIRAEYRDLDVNESSLIYLTISTGIGLAYMNNGKPLHGADGNFGEIGHTIIKTDSDYQCPVCKQYGCVENEISGLAISRKATDIMGEETSTRQAIDMYINDEHSEITAMLDEVMKMTQQLCNNIYSLYNVYTIVLGGGVTNSALPYKESIESYARNHNLMTEGEFKVKISNLNSNVLAGLYDVK
ncbi:ROK family protein [Staphylococcus sp. 18_1_E_LY]|uniref:ROK family protein n=1 Tax=Staphylococcus lloydii TaxID=2781774 RepID=A0A7T1B0N2_9STAP|nr:ROK family protein [Staphylococcus lloydii]MBF7020182.1 ROK family protein [Staphylococcus lloydii]MBF7027865.1 ROK family protein [Staphylococcus lloydii]QPM75537.1 ROK family protein [Staphylococcus lloydii]